MAAAQHNPALSLPTIPTPILVSLATGPVLCALAAGKALSHAIVDLGVSSEEVFRGDRLPVLPFLTPDGTDSVDDPDLSLY